ncbi:hypothetical protein HZS55_03250 [Halosimplex rubrum]|uniref:Uncharacterized protein n=1 Tax=Halosimplex rubrum TaxID=869889 RepID=A0A7D5P8K3_9EURY|nr:hypothetical protein [Halosimplex rubrum]QLH76379.1 hypothetical protein HZS55_03250 [Halosimplex rubrum]
MDPSEARVLQSLEGGTEGFKSVLDRLDGASREDDFVRFERDELDVVLGEGRTDSYDRLSASD